MIQLREITVENFEEVIALQVAQGQEAWVAPNVRSIAESRLYPAAVPLAICADGRPVGFVMYELDPEDGEYWLCRLMIDHRHQGKGYGRAALEQVLARIQQDAAHDRVFLSVEPDNEAAAQLYESVGFRFDGRVQDGGAVMVLQYKSKTEMPI